MKFKGGTIIKGKDLKGYLLCKVLAEDMVMRNFQYHMGENVDVKPLATERSCRTGLHFGFLKDILQYLCYGTILAIIEIPEDEDVYVDINQFRTHRLIIKEVFSLSDKTAWEYLISNRIDITSNTNYAFIWSATNGHLDVVKYLHKNGADITAGDNYAVRMSAINGHLDVVKYLHENGADISMNDDVVIWAALDGYLDVVKYLAENGVDITVQNNCALRFAAENGHLDVVKYLAENGADITADNNYAVRGAAQNGYQDVVDYLLVNGAHL